MRSATGLAAAVAVLSGTTNAFFRMECFSRTALARMDPLVNPGEVSKHAHVIHGGQNFNLDTSYDDLRASDCTSCRVKDDKSAYWTPAMYFQHENGTFELVTQVGGMLVYYNPVHNEGEKVEAYPAGFRMIAGNNKLRSFYTDIDSIPEKSLYRKEDLTQPALAQKGIGFNCLNYKADPEAAFARHEMPTKEFLDATCLDGIRAEIAFPSCWNGEKDSDNHQDHVAYPTAVETGGTCPEGFDRRLPTMLFETKWNTYAFKGIPGEFVFANGDPTGFGYHGDYIMGWDEKILQNAIDGCTAPSGRIDECPVFSSETELQTETDCTKCKLDLPQALANEECAGPMDELCGGDKVSRTEAEEGTNAPAEPAKPAEPSKDTSSQFTTSEAAEKTSEPEKPASILPGLKATDIAAMPVGGQAPGDDAKPAAPTPVVANPAPADPAPAPTQAPPPPPAEPVVTGPTTLFRTVTSNGKLRVEEVVYVEQTQTVYVTAAAPAPQKYRRHSHAHHMMQHRRDREHGLLGHKY